MQNSESYSIFTWNYVDLLMLIYAVAYNLTSLDPSDKVGSPADAEPHFIISQIGTNEMRDVMKHMNGMNGV